MKETKICIIAAIITALIICSTALALPAEAEAGVTSEDYYGKLVVVIDSVQVETSIWNVSCQDKNGDIWEFLNDDGDLRQGDILTLLMFRVNDNEEDDECMEYMWEGYTENLKMFFQVMGWR